MSLDSSHIVSFRNLTKRLSEECNVFLTASEKKICSLKPWCYLKYRKCLSSIDYIENSDLNVLLNLSYISRVYLVLPL